MQSIPSLLVLSSCPHLEMFVLGGSRLLGPQPGTHDLSEL